MMWIQIIVLWLHVLFAAAWFGSAFFMVAVGMPALRSASPPAAFEVGGSIGMRLTKMLGPVGGLTILFGLIVAIAFGPVRSWSFVVSTPYGLTFLIAMVLAVIAAIFGAQTGRIGMALGAAPEAQRPAMLGRIARFTRFTVASLVLVMLCMVLMHYGV